VGTSVQRFDEEAVRQIFDEIDELAASGWMDEVIGGPLTYRLRAVLERLAQLLAEFDSLVPRWHQVGYLRKYLSPRGAELIRAAQEVHAAEQELLAEAARLVAIEEQQQAPVMFYGLSVPLPF
jgi:hypothetical protein